MSLNPRTRLRLAAISYGLSRGWLDRGLFGSLVDAGWMFFTGRVPIRHVPFI